MTEEIKIQWSLDDPNYLITEKECEEFLVSKSGESLRLIPIASDCLHKGVDKEKIYVFVEDYYIALFGGDNDMSHAVFLCLSYDEGNAEWKSSFNELHTQASKVCSGVYSSDIVTEIAREFDNFLLCLKNCTNASTSIDNNLLIMQIMDAVLASLFSKFMLIQTQMCQ